MMSRRTAEAVLLVAAAFAVQVFCAGIGHLYNETDGQYGGAAKVMAEGGDWLIPENNGIPRLVKPPLLYWLMAGGMKMFGVNEFAARLPGALATAGWVAVVYGFGRLWGGHRRGLLAGGILGTILGAFTLSRIVMPEPVFTLFIALSLLCAAVALGGWHPNTAVFGSWVFAGLAAFVKGPHGFLYPAIILAVAVFLWTRFSGVGKTGVFWFSLPGIAAVLLINLPWKFFVESQFPGYLQNLIFSEHLGHVTGSSAPATDYTDVPRLTFLLLHMAWFFPWSIMVVGALPGALKTLRRPSTWGPFAWIVASWFVLVLLSVLLAGQRQDYYAMSLWPAFALLAARVLEGKLPAWPAWVCATLLGAALAACLAAPRLMESAETATVAERATALTTVLQFGPDVWAGLLGIATWTLVPAGLFAVASALVSRLRFWLMAGCGLCLGLGAVAGTSAVSPYFSLASIGSSLEQAVGPEGLLVFDGDIDTGSSLLFYTNLRMGLLGAEPDADFVVRTKGIRREAFLGQKDLETLWRSQRKVVLVTESSKLPQWRETLDFSEPVSRCGTMVAITNQTE